jgi:hypothetical protein
VLSAPNRPACRERPAAPQPDEIATSPGASDPRLPFFQRQPRDQCPSTISRSEMTTLRADRCARGGLCLPRALCNRATPTATTPLSDS